MNSFVTFRCQNQAKVRSFVGKKPVSKIARLQLQGGVIALESTALVVVSDRGVGRIKSYRGTELDVFDPKARAHASHHGLSWQVFSRNGKGRFGALSEKPWEFYRQTMDSIHGFAPGLKNAVKRACPPLQTTTNTRLPPRFRRLAGCPEKLSHHMTIENHSARLRPESVATWFDSGLLRCSGVVRGTIQYSHLCPNLSWRVFCVSEWGWIET